MKKKKRYIANWHYMVTGMLYFPILVMIIIIIIRQIKNGQMGSVLWIIGGFMLFSLLELPFFVIPSTASITFGADCFIYKKNIFKKSVVINYFEITQVYVDFCNEPPLKNLRQGKWLSSERCYIYTEHNEIACCLDLMPNLLRECLTHIDNDRVKINISEYVHIGKHYRVVLENCLTQKQKNILNDLEKTKKIL